MLKVNADNEYKAVERVYSGSTEIDKILDKNGNVLFAVNKEVEGTPALTYTGKEETNLKNYRIYGNTVNGESVGDLITEGEHAGEYRVPVTVEGKNLFDFDAFVSSIIETYKGTKSVQGQTITLTASKTDYYTYPYLGDQSGVYKIPVLPNTKYVLSWETDNNKNGRIYVFLNGSLSGAQTVLQTEKSIKFITQDDTIYATIRFGVYSAGDSITYSNIQLNKGSAVLPYEPYHAPVTTSIYLPEPIKMVGDEAECIDYAEQKQYFADGTSTDVELPALPTLSGTNTLSVGTEVQPSNVYLKGRIKEVL